LKLQDRLNIVELNEQYFNYIWQNRRKEDRKEFLVLGANNDNIKVLLNCKLKFCAIYDDKPVTAFGAIETDYCFFIWSLSTEYVNNHWKVGTNVTIGFLKGLNSFPVKRIIAEKWLNATKQIKWLKMIGFKQTTYRRKENGNEFIWLEYIK